MTTSRAPRRAIMTGLLATVLVAPVAMMVTGGTAYATDPPPSGAVQPVDGLPSDRTSSYQALGEPWAHVDSAFQYVQPSGDLAVATYRSLSGTVEIISLDPATLRPTGEEHSLPVTGTATDAYQTFGGFYAAPNGDLYTLAGRTNTANDDAYDVVEVKRYSSDFRLLGTGHLAGGASQGGDKGVHDPFVQGAAHEVLVGDKLVVHMSRSTYDFEGKQTSLTFEVDTQPTDGKLTVTPFADLGQTTYASSSFQQLVTTNGSTLVTVDHGTNTPRAFRVGLMADYPTSRSVVTEDIDTLPGRSGAKNTGATLDDVVSGPQGVVVLGTVGPDDIDWGGGGNVTLPIDSNLVAWHVDPATGITTQEALTDYSVSGGQGCAVREARAVKTADDRFAVLSATVCSGTSFTEYRLIDSSGAVLATKQLDVAPSTVSEPVVLGKRIVWVGPRKVESSDDRGTGYLYAVDITDPLNPVLGQRAANPAKRPLQHTDFSGDGTAEIGVFRPSTGQWVVPGRTPVNFGKAGDVPVPGDYYAFNPFGQSQYAVYRPSSGEWLRRGEPAIVWGRAGDVPVPGNYDGNQTTDVAMYRPSKGQWFVRGSVPVLWGRTGDVPVPGDYDGNGTTDIADYRPSTGQWFVARDLKPVPVWGRKGDVPVVGDFNGDRKTDLATFRPSTGQWFVRGQATVVTLGRSGDVPRPADYNGDGKTDRAVYRPSTGQWLIEGKAPVAVGSTEDVPLS